MGLIQKQFLKRFFVILSCAFVFGALFSITAPPSTTSALGNCPGQELQVGNTCVLNGAPTSNIPNGVTPPADPADPATPPADPKDPATTDDEGVTCAIEKIGWILCPVIETAGKVGDQAFQFLASNFLETEPELVSSTSGTKTAWELARNIANILFIAAFLVIILSQVTGQGLNNYGIKKMLPRLIVAAIAVNVSYYICQAMVDLTNIIGYEVQNFMVNTARDVTTSVAMPPQTGVDNQTSNGTLGTIAAGVLGVAAIVWFLLPVMMLGVSTVVITCLVIIAILLMRKAFIVLLVVASPIAFVAYLLPNTEKYFQKWLNMFWQLLLVFPIIGLLFGGGQLASAIVLVAGTSDTTDSAYSDPQAAGSEKCIQLPTVNRQTGAVTSEASVGTCAGRSTPFMLGLVAAGIAVAPLIAVWAVLKGALSAAGAIGGKIAGAIQTGGNGANKYARKPEDWARKAAMEAASSAYKTRALKGGYVPGGSLARFGQRRKMGKELRDNKLKAAEAGFALGDPKADHISLQNIAAQQDINAAHVQEMTNYAKSGMAGAGANLGIGATTAREALDAQGKRAAEEVIKSIKEGFQTTDIDDVTDASGRVIQEGMKSAFKKALLANGGKGDAARIKALVDMLGQSNKGQKSMLQVMGSGPGGIGLGGGDTRSELVRQRIQSDVAGAKSSNAAYKAWADNTEPGWSLEQHWENSGSWEKQIDSLDKFTALNADSQKQALSKLSAGRVQELKNALLSSPDAQKALSMDSRTTFGL